MCGVIVGFEIRAAEANAARRRSLFLTVAVDPARVGGIGWRAGRGAFFITAAPPHHRTAEPSHRRTIAPPNHPTPRATASLIAILYAAAAAAAVALWPPRNNRVFCRRRRRRRCVLPKRYLFRVSRQHVLENHRRNSAAQTAIFTYLKYSFVGIEYFYTLNRSMKYLLFTK